MEEQAVLPELNVTAEKPSEPPAPIAPTLTLAEPPAMPPVEAPTAPVEPGKPAPVLAQPPAPSGTPQASQKATDFPAPVLPRVAPVTKNDWEGELEAHSASAEVDVNLMRTLAKTENYTHDPRLRASTSSATGLFQIVDKTWADLAGRYGHLGLNDRMDNRQQARIAPYYMREIQENLERKAKRKPTWAESKLGWVFGPTGGAMLMDADPGTPVANVLSSRAINDNPGIFKNVRTVGELYQWAGQKMGEEGAHPKPAIDLTPYLNLGKHSQKDAGEALSGMGWNLKSRLANMFSDMPPELQKQVKINSGYRSPETQAGIMSEKIGGMLGAQKKAAWDADVSSLGAVKAGEKWAGELRNAGITRTVGLPGRSNHQHGNAADLGYGSDAVKQWVHANAAKYGLGFPMGHEPWHIEALGAREAKYARMGVQADPYSTSQRVPFTTADDRAARKAQEEKAYGFIQAVKESANQDWMIQNMLKANGKAVFDPGFRVTDEMLQRDDIKSLPANYLDTLTHAHSQQDFDYKLALAQKDHGVEQRLSATPYGMGIRLGATLLDPAGILMSVIAPGSFVAKAGQVGRVARVGLHGLDGAIGALGSELPAFINKPGYEGEQLIWAGAIGTAGYLALRRDAWKGTPHEAEVEGAIKSMDQVRKNLETGTGLGSGSVGAAGVPGARDLVRNDIDPFFDLDTEKSGAAFQQRARWDAARHKNSENPGVAAVAAQIFQEPVGNRDKTKATFHSVEAVKGELQDRADIVYNREYVAAAKDFQKRNNIGWLQWRLGGELEFRRLGSAAVRNLDPAVKFDPAVDKLANAWRQVAETWRAHAENPGLIKGETMKPVPGAENWKDIPNYLPRYTNWERFNALNIEFGNKLRILLGEAVARMNPDLPRDLAYRYGGYHYDRMASVEAGQEMHVAKALSGSDMEVLRKDLLDHGFGKDEIEKVLYRLDEKAAKEGGKTLTSRQKRRTVMDENFSMVLEGRSGSREVKVSELWENDLSAIVSAYNKQMSGTVALAGMRIKNPHYVPDKVVKRKVKEKVAREVEKEVPNMVTDRIAREVDVPDVPTREQLHKLAADTLQSVNPQVFSFWNQMTDLAKHNELRRLQGKEATTSVPTRKAKVFEEVERQEGTKKVKETVHDEVEKEIAEVIPGTPEYLVDGIHSEGDWNKLKTQLRAVDSAIRPQDRQQKLNTELSDLQMAYDHLTGVPHELDRSKYGKYLRTAQNLNFARLGPPMGIASISEFGRMIGELGLKAVVQGVPGFRDFIRDIKTGKLLRDEVEDMEYMFTTGTDYLRGSGITWRGSDVASSLNDGASRRGIMDDVEQVTKKLSRVASSVTLGPITTLQERWFQRGAMASFRNAAFKDAKLNETRMRIIGISEDMQQRILNEIRKHDQFVEAPSGRKVRILGIDKWEPQARSAFEHAIRTWSRRTIQQNDLGQMNAVLAHPIAKIMFQFRNFTLGAWSKNTMSALHTRDINDVLGIALSMMFGSMAYAVQTKMNLYGLSGEDLKRETEKRLSTQKIYASAFQRAAFFSVMPGAFDFVSGLAGFEPTFDTNVTGRPTQGMLTNPTIGMIDGAYSGIRGLTTSLHPEGHMTSGEVRKLSRGLNIFHNYPGMLQLVNGYSSSKPVK